MCDFCRNIFSTDVTAVTQTIFHLKRNKRLLLSSSCCCFIICVLIQPSKIELESVSFPLDWSDIYDVFVCLYLHVRNQTQVNSISDHFISFNDSFCFCCPLTFRNKPKILWALCVNSHTHINIQRLHVNIISNLFSYLADQSLFMPDRLYIYIIQLWIRIRDHFQIIFRFTFKISAKFLIKFMFLFAMICKKLKTN